MSTETMTPSITRSLKLKGQLGSHLKGGPHALRLLSWLAVRGLSTEGITCTQFE